MEILITGPFGTIGSRVLAEIVRQGHRVTCLDLDTPPNRAKAARLPASVNVVFGDVTRPSDVSAAVRGKEAVVHLAAIIPPFSETKPELAERVNVEGTRHIVDAIVAEAPNAVLVFPSSISVHGYSNGREPPCRIDVPLEGRDHYARQKIACEGIVRASGIRFVILRIGACASPDETDKGGSIDDVMKQTFALAPETRIEFLHPDDAGIAIANACTTEAAYGKTLFLGSGATSQLRWREFVSTFPRALGIGDFPIEWFGDAPYYTDWMDTEESERLLHFQRNGYPAYERAIREKLRVARFFLTPFRPLVWAVIARRRPKRADG